MRLKLNISNIHFIGFKKNRHERINRILKFQDGRILSNAADHVSTANWEVVEFIHIKVKCDKLPSTSNKTLGQKDQSKASVGARI